MTEKPATRAPAPADTPQDRTAPLVLAVLRVPDHRDWRDAHATHQRVAAATAGTRPLWAMPAPGLLVVQAETVDVHRLAACGAVTGLVDLAAKLNRLAEGTRVRFSLIGNPCRVERVTADRQPVGTPRRVPPPRARRPVTATAQTLGHDPGPPETISAPPGGLVLAVLRIARTCTAHSFPSTPPTP